MDNIGEGEYAMHEANPPAPVPSDNIVVIRYQGHEIVYSLTEPNYGTGEFEGRVPPWAKAMGILHALRHILEVKELESILSIACARMRELERLRKGIPTLSEVQEAIRRG